MSTALGIVADWTDRERTLYVGGELFKHYGCFGCHTVQAYKDTAPIGTELSTWGSKLIARLAFNHVPMEKTRFDFAYAKLMNPRIYDLGTAASNTPFERLQMPRFGFTSTEAKELSIFLLALVDDKITDKAKFNATPRQQDIIRGRQIVKRYNCKGCHVIEGAGRGYLAFHQGRQVASSGSDRAGHQDQPAVALPLHEGSGVRRSERRGQGGVATADRVRPVALDPDAHLRPERRRGAGHRALLRGP